MINLQTVKNHIRIDDDESDTYINTLIDVATEYVTAMTEIENDTDAPKRYDMACMLLIAHWFAIRESVTLGNMQKVPHGFDMLVSSIKPGAYFV